MRLDPYSLKLFVAVARAGSIARAAEQEHIASSALGRRLADLEHAFGTPLLIRSPRGVTLTEAGEVVFQRGLQIDDALQDLLREVQEHGDEVKGTVRLYANMSAVVGFLPERLSRFRAQYPRVRISLHEADTRDVLRACLDDRADIGIGVASAAPAGLVTRPFASDPLQVVVPTEHRLARAGAAMRFAQVLEHPVIGIHQGGALDRVLHERAEALQMRFAPEVSVSCFDAVCRMIEAGLGIAVMPQSAASAYAGSPQFTRLALAEPWAERTLCLYALHRTPQRRSVEALMEALSEPPQRALLPPSPLLS
jgi:DNA-binding transcriptional LysR family regulator